MKYLLIILLIIFSNTLSAKRIISLGLTPTEIITDLKYQSKIIGCDTWSKGITGTGMAVDLGPLEKIDFKLLKELKPDLIIVDAEFSKFGNKEKLNATGLKVHYLANKFSKNQVEENIKAIAKLIGKTGEIENSKERFRKKYAEYLEMKNNNKIKSKVIYLESNYKGSFMIAGNNTSPNAILKDAGNTLKLEIDDWKTITIEEINKLNPDVIIITDKLIKDLGGNEKTLKIFSKTKPGQNDKVIVIEDWEFRNYGIHVSDMLLKIMGTFNENGF